MNEAADPPPHGARPAANPAQLKADIDSGRTGDKVAVSDPAAAPLGTDEEAGGTPSGPREVEQNRRTEASSAARESQSKELVHNAGRKPGAGLGVIIGIVAALVVIAILAWLLMGRQ